MSVPLTTLEFILMAFLLSLQNVYDCLLVYLAFLLLFCYVFCQYNACTGSLNDVIICNNVS